MNILYVKSLPLKDVIADLAKELGTVYSKNCDLYTVEIPDTYGTGQILGADFGNGFGMLNYNCLFREPLMVLFKFNQVHPVKFLHCFQGSFQHQFTDKEKRQEVNQYQNIIIASSQNNGHILYFEAGKEVKIFSIEIDRNNFQEEVACISKVYNDDIVQLLRDNKAEKNFYHEGNYSLIVSKLINEIHSFDKTDILEKFFYKAKSYEILVNQWSQYFDDIEHGGKGYLLRRVDLDRFQSITDYIKNNIGASLSIDDLEAEFELSEHKLQSLFKEVSHTTINAYIKEERLQHAIHLMKSDEYNMSEIVYAIGLSSKSYFSKIFKERFDISPSVYAKRLKENI